jgi:hypothetical protein
MRDPPKRETHRESERGVGVRLSSIDKSPGNLVVGGSGLRHDEK